MSAIEWGTAGEWFSGVMTAGALGAAVWALRSESRARAALEHRLEVERQQEAERPARSITIAKHVEAYEYTGDRDTDHPWRITVAFEVGNESDSSIFDLVIGGTISYHQGAAIVLEEIPYVLLPAGERLTSWPEGDHLVDSYRERLVTKPEHWADPAKMVHLSVTFTDVHGRRWRTSGPGDLSRVDPV